MTTVSPYANTTLANMLQELQQKYKTADTSANGSLSQAEFTSAAQGIEGGLKTTDLTTVFQKMDADGNGELTTAELSNGIDLTDQVQQALLAAQELLSGSTLLSLLGGSSNSSSSSLSSLLGSSSSSSTDTLTALMAALSATYQATEDAAAETTTATTTTTSV